MNKPYLYGGCISTIKNMSFYPPYLYQANLPQVRKHEYGGYK